MTLFYLAMADFEESYFKLVSNQNAGLWRNTLETVVFVLEYFSLVKSKQLISSLKCSLFRATLFSPVPLCPISSCPYRLMKWVNSIYIQLKGFPFAESCRLMNQLHGVFSCISYGLQGFCVYVCVRDHSSTSSVSLLTMIMFGIFEMF